MKKKIKASIEKIVSEDLYKVVEDIEKVAEKFQNSLEIGIQKHNGRASTVTLKIIFKL